jgi:hypothetical protein
MAALALEQHERSVPPYAALGGASRRHTANYQRIRIRMRGAAAQDHEKRR